MGNVFRFECRYQLHSPLFFTVCLVWFLLGFLIMGSESVSVGGLADNLNLNAPHTIISVQYVLTMLGMFAAVAFVAGSITRDHETRTAELLYTTGVTATAYVFGRFAGGTLFATLAVLAGLRIDPRAGALRAAVDHCAENLLAAAALGCDGDEWRAFRSAAASKLARVGPTHAAHLAAIRWLPWSTRKEQEVQDLAAIVAIESLVPLVLERLEARDAATTTTTTTNAAKKKKPRPNSKAKKPAEKSARDDDVDAWQRRAVEALDPVRVDVESDVDAAWAMHTAVHLADIVLHAGTLGGGTGLRGGSLGVNGAPRTPGKEAAECASLDAAAESFMRFLKRTKANIPRSGKTAMNALKNLAVVIFTRQQRAEQLRRTKTEHERANSSGEDSDGEDEDE